MKYLLVPLFVLVSCTAAQKESVETIIDTPVATAPGEPDTTVGDVSVDLVGSVLGSVTQNPVIGIVGAGVLSALLASFRKKKPAA